MCLIKVSRNIILYIQFLNIYWSDLLKIHKCSCSGFYVWKMERNVHRTFCNSTTRITFWQQWRAARSFVYKSWNRCIFRKHHQLHNHTYFFRALAQLWSAASFVYKNWNRCIFQETPNQVGEDLETKKKEKQTKCDTCLVVEATFESEVLKLYLRY